jgi:hypothetical protein
MKNLGGRPIHHVAGRILLETLTAIISGVVLARAVEMLVPLPRANEGIWKSRMWILVQLILDVIVIVLVLLAMNALGLFRNDELVGATALVVFITVFFLAQSQLTVRFTAVNRAATRTRINIAHKQGIAFMQ